MNKDKKVEMDLSDIPLNSSLGLLAYGDLAFEAWRELKKANNVRQQEQTKEKK